MQSSETSRRRNQTQCRLNARLQIIKRKVLHLLINTFIGSANYSTVELNSALHSSICVVAVAVVADTFLFAHAAAFY